LKILLDENFPFPLYHRLKKAGHDIEHLIVLGQRGLPDSAIRDRLQTEDLVFLTQDAEFEDIPSDYRATVIISRVRQILPTSRRIEIWSAALEDFLRRRPAGKLFDLLETGELLPWEVHEIGD